MTEIPKESLTPAEKAVAYAAQIRQAAEEEIANPVTEKAQVAAKLVGAAIAEHFAARGDSDPQVALNSDETWNSLMDLVRERDNDTEFKDLVTTGMLEEMVRLQKE